MFTKNYFLRIRAFKVNPDLGLQMWKPHQNTISRQFPPETMVTLHQNASVQRNFAQSWAANAMYWRTLLYIHNGPSAHMRSLYHFNLVGIFAEQMAMSLSPRIVRIGSNWFNRAKPHKSPGLGSIESLTNEDPARSSKLTCQASVGIMMHHYKSNLTFLQMQKHANGK